MALLVGAIVVPVPAAAADTFSTWTGGPGAGGDNTYDGFIDVPVANATVATGSFEVAGWFVDRTAQGWAGADDVQIFQGTMDGGGKMLARANFAQSRPDVGTALGNPYWAASGFSGVVPPASLAPGAQTLSVYVHTPGKGWWYKQAAVNVSSSAVAAPAPSVGAPAPVVQGGGLPIVAIDKPKDGEVVATKDAYEISGYALDKNAAPNQGSIGSGIDKVQVYIGKDTGTDRDNGATFIGEAELGFSDSTALTQYGGQFASAGWRISFKPTSFHANTYILFAYAHSVVTGREDVAQRFFAIHE
jgi:hypothetical protein